WRWPGPPKDPWLGPVGSRKVPLPVLMRNRKRLAFASRMRRSGLRAWLSRLDVAIELGAKLRTCGLGATVNPPWPSLTSSVSLPLNGPEVDDEVSLTRAMS